MTTILCPHIPQAFSDAAIFDNFFNKAEATNVRAMETRELPLIGVPGESCRTNLFFGFFFDGTKNNYVLAEKGMNHSNVARLYDCYPGLSVPGVLPKSTDWQYKPLDFPHFFKTYIPGVASPFKEINDSGEGFEGTRGAAMGYRGEARLIWALIQAINNVHRYFLKTPLVSAAETAMLVALIDLSAQRRRAMGTQSFFESISASERENKKRGISLKKFCFVFILPSRSTGPTKALGGQKRWIRAWCRRFMCRFLAFHGEQPKRAPSLTG